MTNLTVRNKKRSQSMPSKPTCRIPQRCYFHLGDRNGKGR